MSDIPTPIRAHILVIHDEESARDGFRRIFQSGSDCSASHSPSSAGLPENPPPTDWMGFDVEFACQGETAIALVHEARRVNRPYLMAFADMNAPSVGDRTAMLVELWGLDPDLQVVLGTADPEGVFHDLTARFGPSDRFAILKKPIEPIEVRQLASALAPKRSLLQQSRDRARDLEQALVGRTQAEKAMKEEGEVLQALMENVPDGIYFKDTQSRYTRVNLAQARWMGVREPSEAIGKTDGEVLPSGLPRQSAVDEQWILATGKPFVDLIEKIRTPEGKTVWMASTKAPTRDPQGNITGLVGISRDITERMLVEQQLAYERDLLRALMENSTDMIYFKDLQSRFIRCSRTMALRFGFARMEEAVGKTDFDVFGADHARAAFEDEQEIIRSGKPLMDKVELETWKGTGKVTWALTTKMPLLDQEGSILGTFGISKDVTALKQAEQKLQDTYAVQSLILENSTLGIALVRHRKFVWANARVGELFGLPLHKIQAASTRVIYSSDEAYDTLGHQAYRTLAGGGRADHTLQLCRGDGSLFWCRFIGKALDPTVPHAGSIWAFEDITDRKEAEQKLADANAIQNLILENSTLGVAFVRDQHFVWANSRLAELVGLPLEQVQGASARVVFPSNETQETLLPQAQATVAAGERSDNVLHVRRADGTWFWCRFVGKALDPGSPDAGSIWVAEDITGRVEAEQARQVMELQLRQSQKLEAIGQLAAGIAHEINTPTQYVGDNTRFLKDAFESLSKVIEAHSELLGAVKGSTVTPALVAKVEEALAAGDLGYLSEQVPAAIQETLEGVERVTKIVRAMKEFSHPGGKEMAAADLNRAIETTITVARNEWKYLAEMELDLDPSLPPVSCFLGEFNQCILNLVVNAAHAIGDVVEKTPGTKGRITVRTQRDDDHVEVRVSDTGTGIPEAVRPRIFEPFFTTKDVGKGTGQGLSLVYSSVVTKHGGTVRFETETGQGTTFILRLPLTPRSGSPAPPTAPVPPPGVAAPMQPA